MKSITIGIQMKIHHDWTNFDYGCFTYPKKTKRNKNQIIK